MTGEELQELELRVETGKTYLELIEFLKGGVPVFHSSDSDENGYIYLYHKDISDLAKHRVKEKIRQSLNEWRRSLEMAFEDL